MGIRTNFYKVAEVKDSDGCVGKFTFVENWLKSHYQLNYETDLTLSTCVLDYGYTVDLLNDINLVLKEKDKNKALSVFMELFNEDYTYQGWFVDMLDTLKKFAEYLKGVKENESIVFMAY